MLYSDDPLECVIVSSFPSCVHPNDAEALI